MPFSDASDLAQIGNRVHLARQTPQQQETLLERVALHGGKDGYIAISHTRLFR